MGTGAGLIDDQTDGGCLDGLFETQDALVSNGGGTGDTLPTELPGELDLEVETLDDLPLSDV